MNRYKLSMIIGSLGIILVSVFMLLTTYAYFTVNITEENSDINLITFNENTNVIFNDTSNVSLVNAYTGDEITKIFTVENTSNYPIYYDILFKNVVNNFEDKSDLVYELSSDNNGALRNITIMPSEEENIAKNILILPHVKQTYNMKITFLNKDENQNDNMNKTFSSNILIYPSKNINIGEYIYKNNTILEQMILSSNNEEDGVHYTNSSTFGNTIYYFYGDNLNNNVVFNDMCFKIIRTDDNNDIKLLYNGEYINNECSSDKVISKTLFNSKSNYNAYVGYMYGNASSNNYENEHTNINSSVIKIELDNWYNQKFKDKLDYISSEAIYCNNRKTSSFVIKGVLYGTSGWGATNTGYTKPDSQLYSFECTNKNDRFSISNNESNKSLNSSIGLITYNEYVMLGGNNQKSFLHINDNYWTLTPAYFDGNNAYSYQVKNNKLVASMVNSEAGVRPVITIKNEIQYISGDGSINNPYKF